MSNARSASDYWGFARGLSRTLGRVGLSPIAKRVIDRAARWRVPSVVPEIVNVFPHDEKAFTQGLCVYNGQLYESTGGHGTSSVRAVDMKTGAILEQRAVSGDFAEGIACSDGWIYQLSWTSGRVRVFSSSDLALAKVLEWSGSSEAWGLCALGDGFAITDGTNRVHLADGRFSRISHLGLRSRRLPLWRLNDITAGAGRLYANVYGETEILEFSQDSGCLSRIIDCRQLMPLSCRTKPAAVMNGIALREASDGVTLLATGKYWNRLYELRLPAACPTTPRFG